jgi:hypothetical protein
MEMNDQFRSGFSRLRRYAENLLFIESRARSFSDGTFGGVKK